MIKHQYHQSSDQGHKSMSIPEAQTVNWYVLSWGHIENESGTAERKCRVHVDFFSIVTAKEKWKKGHIYM